jgi:hypothetical protein
MIMVFYPLRKMDRGMCGHSGESNAISGAKDIILGPLRHFCCSGFSECVCWVAAFDPASIVTVPRLGCTNTS